MEQNERRLYIRTYKLNLEDPHAEFYRGDL